MCFIHFHGAGHKHTRIHAETGMKKITQNENEQNDKKDIQLHHIMNSVCNVYTCSNMFYTFFILIIVM